MPRRKPGEPTFDGSFRVPCYKRDAKHWRDGAARDGMKLTEAVRRLLLTYYGAAPTPRPRGKRLEGG